ncbi:MAG: hypothetical protein K2J16_04075 [Clostridia bacterium]|nr:hypothetical protein [Clostridia bacterium]
MKKHKRISNSKLEECMQLYLLNVSRFENVLTTVEVREKGGKFLGSIRDAATLGYYTVPTCETRGQPVTDEELNNAQNFAQLRKCKRRFYLGGTKPCVPVFYRGADTDGKCAEGRSCL